MPLKINEIFGINVFGDKEMKARLSEKAYESVKHSVLNGLPLSTTHAKEIASAMKEWAIEKGATHFTHWFQPMTGITAEKHDGFIEPDEKGEAIYKFSEKSLIKGESDASSLPSGGLRATFEARGYTAWDPTSYAFVKDGSLYIPTAFCSYGGEALDKKTPLLRSIDAINREALRVLKLFNKKATKVSPMVGAEQEYFLISKEVYEKRLDLIHCGKTLFGARPSKGQELDDHYYGAIKSQVSEFMHDLDCELWKYGVYAKTKHNEAAPSQHEIAPVFCSANIATDQNQLTMEIAKSVANKHGLVCLLSEKPFSNVNGSGKHVNWSLMTDNGENLFEAGESPKDNAQFLLFMLAVIKGVNEYQDLLRISVASRGNDFRLGENEAPPAIISMYLGEEIEGILDAIEKGENYTVAGRKELKTGASVLPPIPKDSTDRNRTSPFAFTGNKFEFRMVGSSASIACPVFIINTIVAEELSQFADRLENAKDFDEELNDIFVKTIKENKAILFSGNSYSDEWKEIAKKRGLLNLKSTVDALPKYLDEKNVKIFEKHKVLSLNEIRSRMEILLENYANCVHIESLTALDMARHEITPSIIGYETFLAKELKVKKAVGNYPCELEEGLLLKLSELSAKYNKYLNDLERDIAKYNDNKTNLEKATYCKEVLSVDMQNLRKVADMAELLIGKEFISIPTYEDILYSVKY